jgi:hypothetical protein
MLTTVRPGVFAIDEWDLDQGEEVDGGVEVAAHGKVDVVIIFVYHPPNEVKVPHVEPRPIDIGGERVEGVEERETVSVISRTVNVRDGEAKIS